jgi:spore cortex biosynthesis protein YabQ
MEMNMLVTSQAYIFLCSIAGGIAIAFIYDLFRIRRKAVKAGNFITYLEDLIFWLLVAVIIFAVIFFSNDGEMRGYIFIGTALGVILYMLLFSKLVMKSALFVIHIIAKVLKFFWFVISYPFRLVCRLISIPAGFIVINLRKSAQSVRRAGRNRLSKTMIWRRMLKNIRKKI